MDEVREQATATRDDGGILPLASPKRRREHSGAFAIQRPRARDGRRRDWPIAYLLLLPVMVGFATFYVYPTLRGAWLSLTDYDLLSKPDYVGLNNYRDLLHDDQFWKSLRVTVGYVLINVSTQVFLALLLATVMHRFTRSAAIRAMILLPWLVPNVTAGMLWMWLLDANLGVVNHIITAVTGSPVGFLSSPDWALPSIAIINTWAYAGYTALLLYSGMLQVPNHLYQSASIDGAGAIRTFFHITMPLLRPVLALVLVISLIGAFQVFDTVAVTTQGGPVSATRVISYYIYEQAFSYFNMGYASAVALVLLVIMSLLTAVQMWLLRASRSDLA